MADELNLETDLLLTAKEAAKLLRVHLAGVYRWIESGRLPAWKRGGRLVVRRADLDRLLVPVEPRQQRALPSPRPSRVQTSKESLEVLRRAGFKV